LQQDSELHKLEQLSFLRKVKLKSYLKSSVPYEEVTKMAFNDDVRAFGQNITTDLIKLKLIQTSMKEYIIFFLLNLKPINHILIRYLYAYESKTRVIKFQLLVIEKPSSLLNLTFIIEKLNSTPMQ
jgi:hypothetical protein